MEMTPVQPTDDRQWFVMRDLSRSNAKLPAYKRLEREGITCFTPMIDKLLIHRGKHEKQRVPFLHDLLFVFENRRTLDPWVELIPTLQYRYLRGSYQTPMTVRTTDMERFIRAVESTQSPIYYRPDEITPAMYRHRIRIIGGQLDGCEGHLVTTRGSKVKRLLLELSSVLRASVEVQPEYIQFLEE